MEGSIQKQGKNRYFIVFSIIDPETGKRKQKWVSAGRTRRDAEAKKVELIGDINAGTYKDLKPATFRQFVEDEKEGWLKTYKSKLKPSTFGSYENIICNHFFPAFGDRSLTQITTSLLQRYVTDRGKEVRKGKVAKSKTVINEIVVMKLIFQYALKWGYLKTDPALYVERPKHEKEEMQILTPEEIRAFLNHVNPKYALLFFTALATGMRRGELLGLQWDSIDWTHNQIHVKQALDNTTKQLSTPKTKAARRKIDIFPDLALELKKHKLAQGRGDEGFVFCDEKGKPLDPDNLVKREFLPALVRAEVKRVRFHDLRHTNVSIRIEEGQNLVYISKQIGHSSVKTTLDVYAHLMKEANPEQALKLGRALGFGVEQIGSPSEGVRYLLGKPPKANKKGLTANRKPLKDLVAGAGFEPTTFGL